MASPPPTELQEYVGCLRVHTAYGEGTEKLPSIIKMANQANLDFLVVTDVNTLHYLDAGMEGWYEKTAVIIGEEIAGERGNCLALGIKRDVSEHCDDLEQCLKSIHGQGGFGILCHSHQSREVRGGQSVSLQGGGHSEAVNGIEIWSFLSDWRSGISLWNRRRRIKNPQRYLSGPTEGCLALWDRMLQRRPTAALVAVDAHGLRRVPKSDATALGYRDSFQTLRMHLLLPPFSRRFFEDKRAILDALRRGQGYMANDALAPADGFRFEVRRADGGVIPMGQEATFEPPMTLRVRLPLVARVRLITDGEAWFSDTLDSFDLELSGAGVIRLEATLDDRPWIFSNPVFLRPAKPKMVVD